MMPIRNAVGRFVAVMGCVFALGAQAVEKTYTWSLPSDFAAEVSCADGFAIVQAEGAMRGVGEVGSPDLPVYNFMVTIPKGGSLKGVTYDVEWEEVKVKGEQRILPTPVALPVTAGENVVYPEPGPQYDGVYPAEAAYALEGMLSGNKTLQPIRITPFKWDGAIKTLYVATKLDVKVVVVEKPTLRLTTSSVDTSEGEVLILSPHDFVDLWKGYAVFRKSTDAGKNFTFIVKDTKEIYDNPNLTDREKTDYALTLHHYIETNFYKAASCDKQYIILGASPKKSTAFNPNTMIPTRDFFNDSGSTPHDYDQAGDMYFGCMERLKNGAIDDTVEVWDVGNDGYYWAATNAYPYNFDANNSVDWTMEIAVTRVPLLERSVETLGAKTNEVTAAQMMNVFTNRIAWAESAAFRTEDRGNAYVGGTESDGNNKGGKDERYTGERYFFDGVTNIFDPSRNGTIRSLEWGPRDRFYNIAGKVQPQRKAVIRADITTVTMDEAYAGRGDLATFYCHGSWREYDNLSAPLAYQGGGFYSVYSTCFSCMAGKYDYCDTNCYGITNALCFGEAPVVAPVKENGALMTFTSTRDGWCSSFGTHSHYMDELFLRALYGCEVNDGIPMNAAQAAKYAHNTYSASARATSNAHGGVNAHVVLHGDPLIKVFMMPDRTLNTSELNVANVGYVQKLSVDTTSVKEFTVTGDSAASQAAFSDAGNGTVTLSGDGKFRTTSSLTVTNVANLVWNVAGGAGRNGIVFSGTRGNLTCSGTAERYFGPKLTNVGTISVPGGNVTLDFDTTACDFDKLEFVNDGGQGADRPTNTLRTRAEGFIPSAQTIPVVNSALRLQTINIGGGNATLKDTSLFYVTNGVLKVENNPYWGTEYFVRPTYLSDAILLGEYASFGLGRPDSNGYDLYVDGTSSIGGDTPIKVTGELRIHLEDAATTLTITNALANGHDNATGSVTVSGAGKVVLGTSPTLTGGVTIENGVALELPKIPLTAGGTITVESGAKLLLPEPSSSGIYQVWSGDDVKVVVEDGATICKASAPDTAIAGRFNGGMFIPNDAVIYWKATSGTWQNSASATTCWTNAAGTAVGFTNGQSVFFGPVATSVSVTSSGVTADYVEINAPGSTYTFSSSYITPTLMTIMSDTTFSTPLTSAKKVEVKGGTTTLNESAKESTVKLVEVSEGGTFKMTSSSCKLSSVSRTVKAIRFSFSAASTDSEKVAIQELRLFNSSGRFMLPEGTIIEDIAGQKIRVDSVSGDAHVCTWLANEPSNKNESLFALIDGILGNKNKWWAASSAAPTWFTITFPAAQSEITGYNLRTADSAGRNPKSWTVEVSDDGETFGIERKVTGASYTGTGAWLSGDGSAQSHDLCSSGSKLYIKKGGTVFAAGAANLDVVFDEGSTIRLTGTKTVSLYRPNYASRCALILPDAGGVYVSAEGIAASSDTHEVLWGYGLTETDLAKFTPADNVTLSLSGTTLNAVVNDTKCGPFAATMTSASGATPTWSGLAWTDRYGASVTWNSSLKHSDSAATTITVESLASGGATLNLDVAATLGSIKLMGGSTETLTLSWSAAVVPTTIDLSEYEGKVVLAPGSNLTSTTEIIAGSDTVLPAACTATLTIGANMRATVTDGTYSGTWTLDASGVICFAGKQTTIPLATDATAIEATVEFAGVLSGTSDIALGNAKKTIVFVDGCDLVANRFVLGNNGQTVQHIMQTGGKITLNRTGTASGSSGNGETPLLLSHWPGNDRYWKMTGGEMYVTNGVVRLGWDGGVQLWIGGGESTALMRAKGIRGGSERTNKGTFELDVQPNGVLEIGSSGISMLNSTYSVLKLSGGEIRAYDDASIDCGTGLALSSDSTLSAAEGKTLTVNAAFTGEGMLNVAGAGTVKLTNTTGFPSTVTVADGATLTLPTGYKLEDGKIVKETPRYAINFNVSQGSGGGAYSTAGQGLIAGAVQTVVGEIPLTAWTQQTTYASPTTTPKFSNVTAYDLVGKTNAATTVAITEYMKNTTNISANDSRSSTYSFFNGNLSQKAGTDENDGVVTFTNIPYDKYDVYVYFSCVAASDVTPSEPWTTYTTYNPLTLKVNDGTAEYYPSNAAWGNTATVNDLVENENYLCITNLTGAKLELTTKGKFRGIAAVQIVGTYSDEPKPETVTLTHQFNFNGTMNAQVGSISISASASYVDGICDQAMTYVGNTGSWYGGSGIDGGDANWSVLLVAKAPTTAGHVLFSMGGKSDSNGFGVASAGTGGLKAVTWSNSGSAADLVTATTNDATSTYHLYVFAYDATNHKLKCSIDGADYTEGVAYTYTKNSKWQIGGIHGGSVGSYVNATTGSLDELRVYTGQLTTDDIAEIMLEFQYPYEATISGDTAFSEITGWTQNGVAKTLPDDLTTIKISINGTGKVTGLNQSPIALTLGEGVLCDVSSIFTSETAFSGYGIFLVDASAITADHTFGTSARWGIIGGATENDQVTVSAALTVNCSPLYTYGYVKLSNATFASSGISGLYSYDVRVMSGNLTLGKSTLSARSYDVAKDATITLDSEAELTISNANMMQGSGRAGGFYGQGTFSVAADRTVNGGYLGIATKYAYSGESVFRCQYIWADHGHVGANATLKFTVMDTTLNTYLIDMLTRFTVDNGGKIELYKHGESTAFATFTSTADDTRFTTDQLFGAAATTRDFETEGSQTMGYQGLYTNAVRVANFGYDTGFISALVDEAHSEVTNAVPSEPYSVSLYADLGAFTATNIMTIGNAATRAIRLRVGEGLLQIVEVTGETIRETGIVAARGIGFHLFTITKTNKGVALYVDGQLVGTDFAFTSTVSGPVTIGTGVSVRMFRIDEVQLSEALVANLAAMWPVNETTTPEVQSKTSILNQIRMDSEWAAAHLPESVVTNLYNHEAIKPDDEITGKTEEREQRLEEYQSELEKLGANGLPLWQSYLQGLDPDDTDKTHARPYVNEVRFEEDAVNYQATNTVVELSYANPVRNSGINVTYHLAAKDAVGNVTRNVPVIGSQAMIVDDSQPMNFTPKCEIQPKKPNIIFVLADDLGYGDVGWTVQNARQAAGNQRYISTPHMDQMVAEGCELTAHYAAAPVCAPSRASILTGKHQGTCSLRDNSFDCPILEERTIGTVMREQGYVTHAIGKWGVGGGGESGLPMIAHPLDRGFDHFYGFLDHGAGHTYYHYDGLLNGAYMGIMEDRERKTETAVGLYSTDLLMARAKKVLIDQVATNKLNGTEKPVFMYLAINAMHGSGADKLDASVPNKVNLHVPGRAFPDCTPGTAATYGLNNGLDWDWLQANREPINDRNTFIYDYAKDSKYNTTQARYATTVTRLDEAMQDLKQTIIDLGIADNTIIVFTSDNGPTNEYGTNKDDFDSNGEFREGKRSCYEGGLREPTFIWAPGYIKAGSVDNRPSMNHSWMQFFEEVAKSNTAPQMNNEVYSEYYYSNSQIMVRIGDYVGVNTKVGDCTLDTINLAIYNVVTDPGQTNNIVNTEKGQELLPRMRALMKSYHTLWQRPGGFGNGDGGKESSGRPYDK